MKRYTLNINKIESKLPLVEDERGEWVRYEDAAKQIVKHTIMVIMTVED